MLALQIQVGGRDSVLLPQVVPQVETLTSATMAQRKDCCCDSSLASWSVFWMAYLKASEMGVLLRRWTETLKAAVRAQTLVGWKAKRLGWQKEPGCHGLLEWSTVCWKVETMELTLELLKELLLDAQREYKSVRWMVVH